FRKNQRTEAFFALWEKIFDSMLSEQGLRNDQPAFRTALWMSSEIRHATLPSEYHFICGKGNAIAWEAKVLHDRADLAAAASLVNSGVGPRVFVPGWGLIFGYRGRWLWIKNYLWLSGNFLRVFLNPGCLRSKRTPVNWLQSDDCVQTHQSDCSK